jgi:hypothetical protein
LSLARDRRYDSLAPHARTFLVLFSRPPIRSGSHSVPRLGRRLSPARKTPTRDRPCGCSRGAAFGTDVTACTGTHAPTTRTLKGSDFRRPGSARDVRVARFANRGAPAATRTRAPRLDEQWRMSESALFSGGCGATHAKSPLRDGRVLQPMAGSRSTGRWASCAPLWGAGPEKQASLFGICFADWCSPPYADER